MCYTHLPRRTRGLLKNKTGSVLWYWFFFFLFYCVFCILFQIVVVANDLTVMIGSFAPPEDMLFKVWKGENSTI